MWTSVRLRVGLENFEGVLLASVLFDIHAAMISGRLSFASVEIDKINRQLYPGGNICDRWYVTSCNQGLFSQRQ